MKVYSLYVTVTAWVVPQEWWYFLFTMEHVQEGSVMHCSSLYADAQWLGLPPLAVMECVFMEKPVDCNLRSWPLTQATKINSDMVCPRFSLSEHF